MKYLRNPKPRGHGTGAVAKREAPDYDESKGVEGPPTKKQYKGKYPSVEPNPMIIMQATGEDKNSHDRHVKLIQLEERKVSPNLNVLADLMMRTFSIRRIGIVDEPQPVNQLLKVYPSLRRYDQVVQLNYMLDHLTATYICTFSC